MCPLKLLPKLFLFDEEVLPPELRAQRTLNRARIPEMANYITDNADSYVFSAITASIDGEVDFRPAASNGELADIGHLVVSMTSRMVINDGQHRRAAIEQALEERPELGEETIAVVLFLDADLKRSQQLFADLNKHAVRPTKSLNILYDYRDPLACLARELAEQVPYFKDLVEKEKTTISNRSIKLFTLNAVYQATGALLRKKKNQPITEQEKKMALRFWVELGRVIREWEMAARREVASAELRRDYVHAHSVALHALGIAGASLLEQAGEEWVSRLARLRELDWSRKNARLWEGRAMSGGQMSKARQHLQLTANLIKFTLGLELNPEEVRLENQFRAARLSKPADAAIVYGNPYLRGEVS